MTNHPTVIFNTEDFTFLEESAHVSLLEQDDVQMEESTVWDYIIKWGTVQNPTLPTNLEEWRNENFLTLKSTFQQCLHISDTFISLPMIF